MNPHKDKTDDELVKLSWDNLRGAEMSVEMMRRLKNSIDKLDESTGRYSMALIFLSAVMIIVASLQLVTSIYTPQSMGGKILWGIFILGAIYVSMRWIVKEIVKNNGEEKSSSGEPATKLDAQSAKKAEGKEKVLALAREKDSIKNDDVEKLLDVSNATAERYLNELESEGKLTQHGKIGQGVFYTLKQ